MGREPLAPLLQRLTTSYSPEEDRLRLAGQLPDGTTVALWCTWRLLARLLPPLWTWAEHQARHLPGAETYLEFTQATAQAALEPSPPVEVGDQTASWLVTSVDLRLDEDAVTLTFRGQAGQAVALCLAEVPLRQWLGIVRDLFRHAGWPLHGWPQWLVQTEPLAAETAAVLQ